MDTMDTSKKRHLQEIDDCFSGSVFLVGRVVAYKKTQLAIPGIPIESYPTTQQTSPEDDFSFFQRWDLRICSFPGGYIPQNPLSVVFFPKDSNSKRALKSS